MKTIDYEGTKLNVVPMPGCYCSFTLGGVLVMCHLKGTEGRCDRYCPDGNRALPNDVQSHILLDDEDLAKYLELKLLGRTK